MALSQYGKTWVDSARKCRPSEEWHWEILERDYLIEHQFLAALWMSQFTLGSDTFLKRFSLRFYLKHFYVNDLFSRCPDIEKLSYQEALAIMAADAKAIKTAIGAKYRDYGRPLPATSSLVLEPRT